MLRAFTIQLDTNKHLPRETSSACTGISSKGGCRKIYHDAYFFHTKFLIETPVPATPHVTALDST